MRWLFSESTRFEKWHKWFAWFPVPLDDDNTWAWFEFVWRNGAGGIWIYRHEKPAGIKY